MTFGLTVTGFLPKTLTDIKTQNEEALRASFGQSINLSAQSVFGQINGVMSDRLAELWEVAQELDASADPDRATGAALDAICAITGTIRRPALKSTVTATCTGTPGTVLAIGRVLSVLVTGIKFQTKAAVTIISAAAWTQSTAYAVGQRITSAGRIYQCILAGTSGFASMPDDDLTSSGGVWYENGVSPGWIHLGLGTGVIDVACEAQQTGPYVALANTLRTIETPVAGWQGTTNLADAVIGNDVETDAALRVRREEELEGSSNAALEAIRANILKVGQGTNNPVTACFVFQNVTMSTDADGLPPKSIEVLVQGGEDAAIRAAIFASVSAGIETYGTVSGTVTDSAGTVHTIKFSRPTQKNVYVVVNVVKDPKTYPADGDARIKSAVTVTYPVAKDVTWSAVSARCFSVPGVLEVPNTYIGLAPAPATSATIVCNSRDLAVFDTSRVTVNSSNGSP